MKKIRKGSALHLATLAAVLGVTSVPAFAEDTNSSSTQGSATPASELSLADILAIKVTAASKTKESLVQTPGTVYVVTEEDIRKYGWMSLREVLASVPNLELMWQWNWLTGGQRGFAAPGNFSNTLLMVDGREVQNLIAGEAFITSAFTTHKVSRIEILQGPSSTLYGAAAMQGVINIITKYGEDGKDTTSLQAIRGAVGTEQVSAVYRKSGTDATVGASATYFHSDQNFKSLAEFAGNSDLYSRHPSVDTTGGGTADLDSFRYTGVADFQNPETSYTFDLYAKYKDLYAGVDYFKTINTEGIEYVKPDYSGNESRRGAELYYAGVKHAFNEKSELKVEFQYMNEVDEFITRGAQTAPGADPNQYPNPAPANYGAFAGQSNGDRESDPNYAIRIRSQLTQQTDWLGTWVAGYDLTRTHTAEYTQAAAILPDVDHYVATGVPIRTDNSFFVQNAYTFFNRLTSTLGARYAISSYVRNQVLPRASLVFKTAENSALKATFSEGYRGPNWYEMVTSNFGDNPAAVKMRMLELNYTSQYSMGPVNVMNTAATYWMQTPVSYVSVQNSQSTYDTRVLTTPFNVRGVEDQVRIGFGDLSGFVGFHFVLPDRSSLSTDPSQSFVANVPAWKFKLGVNYQFFSHYDASVFIDHWASVDTEAPTPDGTNHMIYTVPAWTVVNLKLGVNDFKFDVMKLRLNLYVENLFDTAYYHANIRGLGASPLQYLQAPRNARVELTMDL